ncbi:hypothetical protein KGR20_02985 [Cytobacillus oceanisediminis]|uniref:Uncharacterized protein n=1 Tax=Niallia alba TaxID=2729105 RepID=A0A7Y0PNR2_9BACI|nr:MULTISPECIES: hypothetical protein [Bacillaceae]EOR24763.1 hypothetical protein A499_07015 [Niallia nealsonii AAU1]MBQ6447500.1 hypothetical protein [Bacillus sp. (in: firmicutes)]MDU1846608.1 hypothetical protein [Niallia nealsonii]MBZ9533224.1 hypothetical protein [Cytobacillus oceanisediminis]NMO79368.1 hypothetical protein [Niallia alba]
MKKKLGIALLIIIVLMITVTTKIGHSENELTIDTINHPDFLKDKQAVVYLSTTADQDMNNKGISYAVFIDDQGKACGFQMAGLELGSMAISDKQLLIEDKHTMRLIGEKNAVIDRKYQHTGERTGYLAKQDIFFSIYNSGTNSTDGYNSNIYWGNDEGFRGGNLPYYILSSGSTEEEIFLLTADLEKNEYTLRKVVLKNNQLEKNDIKKLEIKKGYQYAPLAPILSDNLHYYILLSEVSNDNRENTVLFLLNKKTLEQTKVELNTGYMTNDPAAFSINSKNGAYLWRDVFFYVNGIGEVFAVSKDGQEQNKFLLEDFPQDGIRHNEEAYFVGDQLFVLRYDDSKKDKYYLESYSLENGEKVEEQGIEGLDKILSSVKGTSIYSYDFKILK